MSLRNCLEEFRQVQVETVSEDITVLLSKKGKATIKRKRKKVQAKAADLSHNRKQKIYSGGKDCGSVSSGSWSYDTGWKDCADEDG